MPFDFSRSQFPDKIKDYRSYIEDRDVDTEKLSTFETARAEKMVLNSNIDNDGITPPELLDIFVASKDVSSPADLVPENTQINLIISLIDKNLNSFRSLDNFRYSRLTRALVYKEDAENMQVDVDFGAKLLEEVASIEVVNERPM